MKRFRILILFVCCFTLSSLYAQKPDSVRLFQNDSFFNCNHSFSYMDKDGNLYYAATIDGYNKIDVDLGPGVAPLLGNTTRLIKYDKNYRLLWVKNFQSKFEMTFTLIEGNRMYVTGIFDDSVDFNPDPAIQELRVSNGSHSYFLMEMDTSGNYRRMFLLSAPWGLYFSNSRKLNLRHLSDGTFIVHFWLNETVDVDPGPDKKLEVAQTDVDHLEYNAVLLKLDSNFGYIRHQAIRNDTSSISFSFLNGYIYINLVQTIDIRPDRANPTLVYPRGGEKNLVFLKYDEDLNFIQYMVPYWGNPSFYTSEIMETTDSSYLITLFFKDSLSLAPGNPAYSYRSRGKEDAIIIKTKNLQTFAPIAAYHFGGSSDERFSPIGHINKDNVLIFCFINSYPVIAPCPDFDPGEDTFIVDKTRFGVYALIRLDKDLNFRWAGSWRHELDIYVNYNGFHFKNDSTFLLVGSLDNGEGKIDLDLGWGKQELEPIGNNDRVYFAQYTFPTPAKIMLKDSLCEGDSMLFRKTYLTHAGIYQTAYMDSSYRDSIVELKLDVLPTYLYHFAEDTLCYGNQVSWRNKTFTESGIYYDSLKTTLGCDSIFSVSIPFSKVDTSLKQVNNLLVAAQFQKKYIWVDCYANYAPIPNITVNGFTPPHGGFYGVIVENPFGCVDTSRCVEIRYVGMEDQVLFPGMEVYPNPFSDVLHIDGLQAGANLRLVNTLGMEILNTPSSVTSMDLQLRELPAGIYFLEIEMDGRQQRVKVVKE